MSYGLYIGRDHTADGIPYLAGYGDEPSAHWLELVPRRSHGPEDTVTVGVTPDADLPGRLSEIPQVAETARHLRVSYSHYLGVPAPLTNGGLNEHGVAVRDIWSPSRRELVAMTPPDQTGPNYSDLARIVVERATSARDGVEIIADLIARHGYSCYGGNSHIIADPDEAWVVIEFSGGRRLWVAERLGPASIRASRPGYIGAIPSEPDADYLFPPHFIRTAIELGWYRPSEGPFDVNRVYGDGKGRWAGVAWIEDEMRARAARPQKVTLPDMFWAISSERLTGDTAGYGQVVPLRHPRYDDLRMMWHAPVGATTTPLMPVFLGQSGVPLEYGPHRYLASGESSRFLDRRHAEEQPHSLSRISQGAESVRSAFHVFKRLMHLVFQQPEPFLGEVSAHWRRVETKLAAEALDVQRSAELLLQAGEARLSTRLLDDFSSSRLSTALADAEALVAALEVRLRSSDGLNLSPVPKAPEQLW